MIKINGKTYAGPCDYLHGRAKAALERGEAVVWEDGTVEWHTWQPIQVPGPTGGRQYRWHRDRSRVLHELVIHLQTPDGARTSRVDHQFWRQP